jgi:hypothetical protein
MENHIAKREAELQMEALAKQEENNRKNYGFTQLDDLGMSQLKKLMLKSSQAAGLFLDLCTHMNHKGAVVVSRPVLAEMAGVSTKNLGRLTKLLVDYGLIRDFKVKGVPIIAINPDIAWRSHGNGKNYAVFNATVLLDETEIEDTPDFDIRRATAVIAMAKKKKGQSKNIDQKELPPPVGEEAENLEVVG